MNKKYLFLLLLPLALQADIEKTADYQGHLKPAAKALEEKSAPQEKIATEEKAAPEAEYTGALKPAAKTFNKAPSCECENLAAEFEEDEYALEEQDDAIAEEYEGFLKPAAKVLDKK